MLLEKPGEQPYPTMRGWELNYVHKFKKLLHSI